MENDSGVMGGSEKLRERECDTTGRAGSGASQKILSDSSRAVPRVT